MFNEVFTLESLHNGRASGEMAKKTYDVSEKSIVRKCLSFIPPHMIGQLDQCLIICYLDDCPPV